LFRLSSAAFDNAISYSGPVVEFLLLTVIVIKARWREVPAFTSMIAVDLAATLISEIVYDHSSRTIFRQVYICIEAISFFVQLAVATEIARTVLRRSGIWVRGAKKPLLLIAGSGMVFAAVTAFLVRSDYIRGLALVQIRADVFGSLVILGTVVGMMISANEVGLPWRSHTMAIGQGLLLWSLAVVAEDGVAAFMGPHNRFYGSLYYVRCAAYLATVLYWTVALWHEEPARKPISPALRNYIVALNDRVQYDLKKAGR
jgi:hypothetical protein